jgi:hypothetical protein
VPARRADDDDLYLALAAVVLSRANLGDDAAGAPADGADELALLRRRRFEEHALARARHPSARARRSA